MTVLSAPAFGGGVVREGSADAQRTDELEACDAYDIGPRGQLIATSDLTEFAKTTGGLGGTPMTPVFGMEAVANPQAPILLFVGIGSDGHQRYGTLFPDGSIEAGGSVSVALDPAPAGVITGFAAFPYVDRSGVQRRIVLVVFASRSFQLPRSSNGMFVFSYDPVGPSYSFLPIQDYDALSTGTQGEFPNLITSTQLCPRGVVAYNNHAFCWGFDDHDHPGGDGPNRLMFSNIGNPLKWGNDPLAQQIADGTAVEVYRTFEDSDAVTVGGAGEAIRCCYDYRGKLYIGTNRQLNYLEGFGRESFKTNGSLAVLKSRNVIGPHCMIEGPDALLYGVSDEGLWKFNGGAVEAPGDRLRDYKGRSIGYWDLIWSDPSRTLLDYPGRTNQDFVWMMVVDQQVWVIIPHCNATAGFGFGTDTVIVKYHTKTGGFTRQVFIGRLLTAGAQLKREGVTPAATFICDSSDAVKNIERYAYKALQTDAPVMPVLPPDVTFGPYAPFGADGVGVMKRKYLTLAWETSAALPITFTITPTIDGEAMPVVHLTIGPTQPFAPANGDLWVDTSGTDTSLGNVTAGTFTAAHAADYVIREYVTSWAKWVHVPGGGQQGTRMSIPIAFKPARGSRFTIRFACTAAAGRFQLENFSDKPSIVREAV